MRRWNRVYTSETRDRYSSSASPIDRQIFSINSSPELKQIRLIISLRYISRSSTFNKKSQAILSLARLIESLSE